MVCVLVFYRDEIEAIRKLTGEILAIMNLGERDWIVEIRKGTCNVLVEHEHILV